MSVIMEGGIYSNRSLLYDLDFIFNNFWKNCYSDCDVQNDKSVTLQVFLFSRSLVDKRPCESNSFSVVLTFLMHTLPA